MLRSRFVPSILRLAVAVTAALLGFATHDASAATITYNTSQNATAGSWQVNGNWVGGTAPASGSDLVFGSTNPVGARTTTNNTAGFVVNSITYSGTTRFTLSGSSIVLAGSVSGGGSTRDQIVSLPITLSNPVTVTSGTSTNGITFNGAIDNGGNAMTLAGTVNMLTTVSGSGALITSAGSNVKYSGATLGGDLTVGGTMALGNASRIQLAIGGGDLTVQSGATLNLDVGTLSGSIVDPPTSPPSYDQFQGTGAVTYGGTLNLDLTNIQNTFTPVSNVSTWDLFNFASYSGDFTTVTATGGTGDYSTVNGTWTLTGGKWLSSAINNAAPFPQYFSFDATTGNLSVVGNTSSVPEIDPAGLGSVLAFATGTLGLLERRRRGTTAG